MGKKDKIKESQPIATSVSEQAGPWECEECNQENEASDKACCACDHPRPGAVGSSGDSFFKVGRVIECEPVPGKDKLKQLLVDVGAAEPIQVVTNAPNVAVGSRIVVAMVGATVTDGGEEIVIKKASVGGAVSNGMVCSAPMLGWKGGGADTAALLPESFAPGAPPPSSRPRLDQA